MFVLISGVAAEPRSLFLFSVAKVSFCKDKDVSFDRLLTNADVSASIIVSRCSAEKILTKLPSTTKKIGITSVIKEKIAIYAACQKSFWSFTFIS